MGAGDSEWVTWPEAAAIVGCPVPTIDWHSRTGRIKTRPQRGRRPSVDRASVEEFATWWRAREARRVTQRAARVRGVGARERPGEEWLSSTEAAEILDVSPGQAVRLIQAHCRPWRPASRWWVKESEVRRLADQRAAYVSYAEAARIVGCAQPTIGAAVRRGEVRQRPITNRALPSLDRDTVMEFAEIWTAGKRARAKARERRRAAATKRRGAHGPPDDGHVWLDTTTTALVLGLSRTRVDQLALAGRLPHRKHHGRRWFTRDHVEQVAAARAITHHTQLRA